MTPFNFWFLLFSAMDTDITKMPKVMCHDEYHCSHSTEAETREERETMGHSDLEIRLILS